MLLTALMTLLWLLASPTLQLRDSGWVEVGAAAAAAAAAPATVEKKKKTAKKARKRMGSPGVVTSNQPGLYPMQPITAPQTPVVTGTVILPALDPRYPTVPTVPVIGQETSQGRVARCTHQGALGGLPPGEQGTYVHNCAF